MTSTSRKFRLLEVTNDSTISEVCAHANISFSSGCGYYCVVKSEKVSAGKEFVAINEKTGEQVDLNCLFIFVEEKSILFVCR